MAESVGSVVRMSVAGMTCDHCVRAVRKAIESVPGVRAAAVDLAAGRADVRVVPGWVDESGLRAAVSRAGYQAIVEDVAEVGAPEVATAASPDEEDGDDDADGPSPGHSRPAVPLVSIGPVASPSPRADGSVRTLSVSGMHCAACVARVEGALTGVPGVRSAEVDLIGERARVLVDPAAVDPLALERAVAEAGYTARLGADDQAAAPDPGPPGPPSGSLVTPGFVPTPAPPGDPAAADRQIDLAIKGMHCASCVARVEKALTGIPGVREARVNLATDRARIVVEPDRFDESAIGRAVADAGYGARLADTDPARAAEAMHHEHEESVAYWRRRAIVGVALTLPLLVLGLGPMLPGMTRGHGPWVGWAMLVPAAVLQAYLGGPYIQGAIARLRQGSTNMDTLIALGTSTAFGYSLYHLLAGQYMQAHFFMDSGIILTLITIGSFLEARSKGAAGLAIERLLDLAPKTARVVEAGGASATSRCRRSPSAPSSASGPAMRSRSTAR